MIDGPDGVGKGTLTAAAASFLMSKSKEVFELQKWWLKNSWYPSISELLNRRAQVLISAEPTYVGIGREIRNELISEAAVRAGRSYTAEQTAQAYALDRAVLYQAIIIPALKAGLTVIQERGFPSSFAYQPLQASICGEKLTLEDVKKLAGNQLATKHAPNLLIIPTVVTAEAMARIENRLTKKDDSIFEKVKFQEDLRSVYASMGFKEVFEKIGTEVVYIDASGTAAETASRAIVVIDERLRRAGVLEGPDQKSQVSLLNF